MKKILYMIIVLVMLGACEENFLDPKLSNDRSLEQMLFNPGSVQGFLADAYVVIPSTPDAYEGDFLDVATQNAVTNIPTVVGRAASDGWLSFSNPISNYSSAYDAIQSVNRFILHGLTPEIRYNKGSEDKNAAIKKRLEGEAYFLRGYHYFELLRRHAGVDASGNLMGVPLITEVIDGADIPELPRASYAEVVNQIVADLDHARSFLPVVYTGGDPEVGESEIGRPTSVACDALKSRVLLYAGSELFGLSNASTMNENAAEAAALAMDQIGSLPNVYSGNLDAYFNDGADQETIMRKLGGTNRNLESKNFPPSLLGSGRTNPTQNLVDAFPTADGYPIDHPSSSYDANDPYNNRESRFYMTIIHNGASLKNETIETFEGGKDTPGGSSNANTITSTITGYYLRKWLSSTADLTPTSAVNDQHYYTIVRKGEVYLNYAEAANEAWGPEADPNNLGYTAVDAIREVRRRAGISQPDAYLDEISGDQNAVRELIRNERRIELCFEGHYFYDIRRWNGNLNEPVKGVSIVDGVTDTYTEKTIYTPKFESYMYFGPLPYAEVIKTPSVTQNKGW